MTKRLVAAAISAALFACTQSQDGAAGGSAALGQSSADVNGRPIPESVLRLHSIATFRKNLEDLTLEERTRALDDLIGVVLLVDAAEKEGLTESRSLTAQIEYQRLQLIARAMAKEYLEKNPVSELELQSLYEENLPQLTSPQYKARHIVLESRESANQVIEQLQSGKTFLDLAQEHADGPTGPNGGDLGWFTAESMIQPVADAVRSLQVGSFTTEPVQTDFGFHVILLEDTRAQEPPALNDLRNDLQAAAERKRLEEYLRGLSAAGTVAVTQVGASSSPTK